MAETVKNNKPSLKIEAVHEWLQKRFGKGVSVPEPLSGGFWSAAFAFKVEAEDLVIRFNRSPEGFAIDQAAMRFRQAGVPVPVVTETGTALDLAYAISHRKRGMFLEDSSPGQAPHVKILLADLFRCMRTVPPENVEWYQAGISRSWHEYLSRSLSPNLELGSRQTVRAVYQEASDRIAELLPLCPERRDLVHADLLHQNVLISTDADKIEAVFSWKCSCFGDFLYDIAWCTHWSPWHPGIAAADVFSLVRDADDLDAAVRLHLPERHHCYELHIAVSHIAWYLSTNDEENLSLLIEELAKILDRGPLPS